jgi:hypothetical protein
VQTPKNAFNKKTTSKPPFSDTTSKGQTKKFHPGYHKGTKSQMSAHPLDEKTAAKHRSSDKHTSPNMLHELLENFTDSQVNLITRDGTSRAYLVLFIHDRHNLINTLDIVAMKVPGRSLLAKGT